LEKSPGFDQVRADITELIEALQRFASARLDERPVENPV
jgi:hypothetical protein